MKLPPKQHSDDKYNDKLFDACQEAAIKLTVKTGIIIKVISRPIEPACGWRDYDYMTMPDVEHEIVFRAMDNNYNTLPELRKALKLKAFI